MMETCLAKCKSALFVQEITPRINHIGDQLQSADPDYVQVLVILFQYLTIYNDNLIIDIDEDQDHGHLEHHFKLAQKVVLFMASTFLSEKFSWYLFSILDLASEVQDHLGKIGHLLSLPALGTLKET